MHRRSFDRRLTGHRRAVLRGLAAAVLLLPACVTEHVTSDGRPMPPEPKRTPPAPQSAAPNRMMLLVGRKAQDTDGNGYPDLVTVEIALFAQPHPTSVEAPGRFVFTLYRLGAAHDPEVPPLREWVIESDVAAKSRAQALYGTCYRFRLSLLDAGSDRLPTMQADLRGRFEPAGGGDPVPASDEVRLVQLGRS
jgi:hypothetical protein